MGGRAPRSLPPPRAGPPPSTPPPRLRPPQPPPKDPKTGRPYSPLSRQYKTWKFANTKVWGIFVKDWARITFFLLVLWTLAGLIYTAYLTAAHNVRRAEYLTLPRATHFSDEGSVFAFLYGNPTNRSPAAYASLEGEGLMGVDATAGPFNVPVATAGTPGAGDRTWTEGNAQAFPWHVAGGGAGGGAGCPAVAEAGAPGGACSTFVASAAATGFRGDGNDPYTGEPIE